MQTVRWIKNKLRRPYLNKIDLAKRILEVGPLIGRLCFLTLHSKT